MPKKRNVTTRSIPSPPPSKALPKELKLALLIAIPFGILAALIVNGPKLSPVSPERLVEVVWRHQCSCARSWMGNLRAEGFVVRDFELDDLKPFRDRWNVPDSARGCHPARYMGYFIDGHATAEDLRKLAQEGPVGIGLVIKEAALAPDSVGQRRKRTLVLIDKAGSQKPWP